MAPNNKQASLQFPTLGKKEDLFEKKKKLDGTFRLRDKILNAREFKEATKEAGTLHAYSRIFV